MRKHVFKCIILYINVENMCFYYNFLKKKMKLNLNFAFKNHKKHLEESFKIPICFYKGGKMNDFRENIFLFDHLS